MGEETITMSVEDADVIRTAAALLGFLHDDQSADFNELLEVLDRNFPNPPLKARFLSVVS